MTEDERDSLGLALVVALLAIFVGTWVAAGFGYACVALGITIVLLVMQRLLRESLK